jgi:tetratricopeptide (TPR) repeat protein
VRVLAAMALALLLGARTQAQHGPLDGINTALQQGEADQALSLLAGLPADESASAEAHNLRCRVYFILENFDTAVKECQQAVEAEGQNSDYHMWLGRALGEKASRASFVSAYGLAKRTREEFEQATQLNPRNAEALADLGEFYSSAPGVVGGGMDKAQGVAAQLDKVDPARAHELRARIAEGNKDYATAEREFHAAIAASAQPAFQWITLASYLRRRQRLDEMDAAVQKGWSLGQQEKHAAVALNNGASVLIKANRNLALAAKMLDAYLASPMKTEEAPAFTAHVQRARVAAKMGNTATAKRERDTALTLAKEYKPALDLKF